MRRKSQHTSILKVLTIITILAIMIIGRSILIPALLLTVIIYLFTTLFLNDKWS